MSYIIDGVPVGHDPKSFNRTKKYEELFLKIGNSSENIKVIKEFISKEDCEKLLNLSIRNGVMQNIDENQWEERIYLFLEQEFPLYILNLVKKEIEESFNFEVKNAHNVPYVVVWHKKDSMDLHVDDLGVDKNHMSAVIYLNNDYEGGEISFPTHSLNISPKTGDLIIFPGNLNYAHKVNEITSGYRYTMPIWFSFSED